MKTNTVAAVLLLEGLASTGLQMLMIRQVTGHVGSSVLVTSIVISTFLAALALGYYFGGQSDPARFQSKLIRNLAFAIAMFAVGLSYPVVAIAFELMDIATGNLPLVSHPLFHLFLFSWVVLAPLVFALGQTVPLLLNTAKADMRTSEAAGNLTALSTVGNVIGCLLTALVLLVLFGVGMSILLNCLMLFAAMMLCMDTADREHRSAAYAAMAFLAAGAFLNTTVERHFFDATTEYANISVRDFNDGRALVINQQNASFFDDEGNAWDYIETMRAALMKRDESDILVLGAGGFTLSADPALHKHSFTYVDIDNAVKDIAEQKLLQQPIAGKYEAEDARSFLLTRERAWDVVVVDLFTSSIMIPAHTATLEFFQLVRQRVASDGLIMLNIIADPMLNDAYSIRIDKTVREAFGRCVTDIVNYDAGLANLVYFCQGPGTAGKLADVEPYRDDTNTVSIDGYLLANRRSDSNE